MSNTLEIMIFQTTRLPGGSWYTFERQSTKDKSRWGKNYEPRDDDMTSENEMRKPMLVVVYDRAMGDVSQCSVTETRQRNSYEYRRHESDDRQQLGPELRGV